MKNKIKFSKKIIFFFIICIFLSFMIFRTIIKKNFYKLNLTLYEEIGQQIFFDVRLSEPQGMSCASCHNPKEYYSGNNGGNFGVSPGSRVNVSGMRNTPTIMYTSFTPIFHFEKDENGKLEPVGGFFLDGRADTLAAQSTKPFFNAREMNNANPASLIKKISESHYADLFYKIGGKNIFADTNKALKIVEDALQAFESTKIFNPFSSKYDDYIQGRATLTIEEKMGLELFKNTDKGNCIACHKMNDLSPYGKDSLFTDYTYDNLSVPRNSHITDNNNSDFFDLGLCGPERTAPLGDMKLCGAFQVPSLRNVAKRKFYFHNGYFDNLHDAIAFYATRDTNPEKWYPKGKKFNDTPLQYQNNINTNEVPYNRKKGEKPALTDAEINAIIAFLNTLTDPPPKTELLIRSENEH